MSSSDKRKHKISSAKAEIIKQLDKVEEFINLAKGYGIKKLRYMLSGKIERRWSIF
jgi:hypothetical protein